MADRAFCGFRWALCSVMASTERILLFWELAYGVMVCMQRSQGLETTRLGCQEASRRQTASACRRPVAASGRSPSARVQDDRGAQTPQLTGFTGVLLVAANLSEATISYGIVGDDGSKTFIQMRRELQYREAPVLLVLGPDGKGEMTNYRVREQTYIIDRLFDRARLVLGTGKKAQKVEISRDPRG